MKKKIITLASLSAVFALGIGLAINTQKQPIAVEAAQHTAAFTGYTYSGSYYGSLDTTGTDGINGTFNTALSNLIYPKNWYTYGGSGSDHLSTILQSADQDPENSANMIYLYTRDSVKKNAASSWNREHVWPQSLSNNNWGTDKAGADLLHIRPTYETTNSTRGNKKYGYISGSKTTETYQGMTYGYTSGNYFEPLDSVKGDVARTIMYLYTTYNLKYTNKISITNVFASYDTLLKWHTADQPDVLEGNRNNFSETSIQKNRNPFVDHPEYAWRIFGDSCSAQVKADCMAKYPIEGYVPNPDSGQGGGEGGQGQGGEGGGQGQGGQGTIPTSGTYSIAFKNNGSDSGSLVTEENYVDYVSSNTLVKSVSGLAKIYPGANGLKLGSGSGTGAITFNLKDEAKNNIDAVYIKSAQYSSDSSSIVLKIDGTKVADDITPGEDYEYTFTAPTTINSIAIETSGKRAYINELAVHIYQEQGQGGGEGQGEQGQGGEQGGNTSEAPVDSSEPLDPSINPDPPVVAPEPEEEKGCGGSIIATTSLFAISALAGLSFIFIKRRRY